MSQNWAVGALDLVWPGLFAGAVAVLVTMAIERWGGRAGGLIGTLPSTIVPAAIGIAQQSETVADFQTSMYATPGGMFLNALFLLAWRVLPSRLPAARPGARLLRMVLISVGLWGGSALLLVLGLRALAGVLAPAWFGYATTVAILLVGILACRRAPPAPRGVRSVSVGVLVSRGLCAAIAVSTAVYLAHVGGPVVAALVAVFPAIFLTTMVSLWLAQGEAVQVGAVGPMMLGSTSVATYALVAAWALPSLGPILGSVLAWCAAALLVTAPAQAWLARRSCRPPSPSTVS